MIRIWRQHHSPGTLTWCRSVKKTGEQTIGRSQGGLTTKIHAVADVLGNPVRCILNAAQVAKITQISALNEKF